MESSKIQTVAVLTFLCLATYGQEWPSLLFQAGETGLIPCIPKSVEIFFYWRKGEEYNVSKEIAYNIAGTSYSTSERHEVLLNGTLKIKNIAVEDGGRYFCRLASSASNCYASVTVYIRVTIVPYIDRCSPGSSCTVYSKPDSTNVLTCKAMLLSPQMRLKWFNGSKEIVENVKVTEIINSRNETEISSKLTITFKEACFLTCEATDVQIEKSFAHVQLKPEEADTHPIGFIVVVSILAVILCAVLVAAFWKLRKRKADPGFSLEELKDERVPMLQGQLNEKDTQLEGTQTKLTETAATLEGVMQKLKNVEHQMQEKDAELKELKTEFSKTNEKLKRSNQELAVANKEVTLKNESLKTIQQTQQKAEYANLQRTGKESNLAETVNNLNSTVAKKDQEVKVLNKDVAKKNAELKDLVVEAAKKDAALKVLRKEFDNNSVKLKALTKEVATKDAKMKALTNEVATKDAKLKKHEEKAAENDQALKICRQEVSDKDADVKKLKDLLKASAAKLMTSKRDDEFSKRELRSKMMAIKEVCRHLCLIKMPPVTFKSVAERKNEKVLIVGSTDYNYNYVFELNATKLDAYMYLEELIQNSMDGGNSCIFVLCSSINDTSSIVYDTGNKADEGIIPRAIHKMFQVPKSWKEMGLMSDISATFATFDENKFTYCCGDGLPPKDEDAGKVSITSEENVFKILQKHREEQTVCDEVTGQNFARNNFVRFFIDTKCAEKKYSSGTLTFSTFSDGETIKNCFQQKPVGSTKFEDYVNSVVKDYGTKVAILTILTEGSKDAIKNQVRSSEFINGVKKSFLQRHKPRLPRKF